MKFCKDCKHFNHLTFDCVRGKRQIGVDPVNGEAVFAYKVIRFASTERSRLFGCGKKGRHFEPKEQS